MIVRLWMNMRCAVRSPRQIVLWSVFFLVLTAIFYHDGFGYYADIQGVEYAQDTGQGKIYSRIILSYQEGILSKAGLLGFCKGYTSRFNPSLAYQKGTLCKDYKLYKSQTGGQAMIYSLIYLLNPDLYQFEFFAAISLALTLVIWLIWVKWQYGVSISVFSFFGIISLRHLVLLGDNVSLLPALNYMIFIGLLWALELRRKHIGRITFSLFILKYLFNGAEFVAPLILTAYLPLVYYGLKDGWGRHRLGVMALKLTHAIILSSLVAASLLFMQVSIADSINGAYEHFSTKFFSRSVGYDFLGGFNELPTIESLIAIHLNRHAIDFGWVHANIKQMLLILVVVTALSLASISRQDRSFLSLLCITWLSLLIPVSYFLLMHGHSYTYMHLQWNPIIWDMPFNLLLGLLSGLTLKRYLAYFVGAFRSQRPMDGG